MTAVMGLGGAWAQDFPAPNASDAMSPSDFALPSDDAIGPMATEEMPPAEEAQNGESSVLAGERRMTIDELDGCDNYTAGPADMWDEYSAPIESTGTWLRRGFWYAQTEAVVWNRFWNRDAKFLAAQ